MTQQEKNFMEEHIFNYETIKSGYVRNLDLSVLNEYERIYRSYLDKNFVLTKWCSDCVYETLKRLYEYYFSIRKYNDDPIELTEHDKNILKESESVEHLQWVNAVEIDREKRKRGRPKK